MTNKMEFKLTEEKENALFNRREVKGFVEREVVPSRAEILKILSEKFKTSEKNIKIKKIAGKFGSKIFNIDANIYSSEKDKDSVELKKKKEMEKKAAAEETATKEKPEQKEKQPIQEQAEIPEEKPSKEPKPKPQEKSESQREAKEQ